MKQILKILLAASIIAFAASMLAVSCGKKAGGGNNSGNNEPPLVPTTNLTLRSAVPLPTWAKIRGNTVTISAAGFAGEIAPHSDADDNNRGFDDLPRTGPSFAPLFQIDYPGATAVMFFVNRASVSTNSITMPATVATCQSSETDDNTLATGGNGTCREYTAGGNLVDFRNYLGTVFNNTDTANHARGTMRCNIKIIGNIDIMIGVNQVITDTLAFIGNSTTYCHIGMVNNGLGASVEIDDAWVDDSDSTNEVELHAIGINISGKMIPQFSSETGYGLSEFIKAHDNTAFKKLLRNNEWGELKFKVKIVTATNF